MLKLAAIASAAAALGGCSVGARYFPGLDDRVGPAIQGSLTTEGLVSEQSSPWYGRLAAAFYYTRQRPSEVFPGEEDDWSGFGVNVEAGTQVILGGTDEGRTWFSLGLQAGYLDLTRSTQIPTDDGGRTYDSDSDAHFWGGPVLRVGYGWVQEKNNWPKPHCESCHESETKIIKRRLQGPELGIGYAWFTDLGSGPILEFTFLNLFF
jgi:hypothetical protein